MSLLHSTTCQKEALELAFGNSTTQLLALTSCMCEMHPQLLCTKNLHLKKKTLSNAKLAFLLINEVALTKSHQVFLKQEAWRLCEKQEKQTTCGTGEDGEKNGTDLQMARLLKRKKIHHARMLAL